MLHYASPPLHYSSTMTFLDTPISAVAAAIPVPVAPYVSEHATREQWLESAVKMLQDFVFDQANLKLPPVKVSCSWPGGGSARKRIGECWSRAASNAKINEIFISPSIEASTRVLDVLCHELCHAIDDCKNHHKAPFTKLARAIGLEGKPTQTSASAALMRVLKEDLIPVLGEYPHARLNMNAMKPKDPRAAFIKFTCTACDMAFRVTAGHAGSVHMCPSCGSEDDLVAE